MTADRKLIDWYRRHRQETPAAPFMLGPGRIVVDRQAFLDALDRDVSRYPHGPRASALLDDLRALRGVIEARTVKGAA